MARLTEEMVIARSKQSELSAIKKLNCWGAELGDVSVLRRMPNVEVLAFSLNKIRRLEDFSHCRRLRELYIRKNEVGDLAEIRHLRRLPLLQSLWLDENPCTQHDQYRMTVLRNLPNLETLDNVPVQPEEVAEAMRRGRHIPDSDDEDYPQQEQYNDYRRRSPDSSPERDPAPYRQTAPADPAEPPGRADSPRDLQSPPPPRSPDGRPAPAMTRSHYEGPREPRSPDRPLRHSVSSHSVAPREYSHSANGDGRQSPRYQDPYTDRLEGSRCESYQQLPRDWDPPPAPAPAPAAPAAARDVPSAVMTERRGFTRRPVARNSNLLSAVLCLVKELDYPSLEVAEMAVRCRMDELANGQ